MEKEKMDMPERKLIDHRGPMRVDVRGAWYFITICAEGHREWMMTKPSDVTCPDGRVGAPRTPPNGSSFDTIAKIIIQHAREYHQMGKWRLALFIVMPDHLHFIVHVPEFPSDESGVRIAERSETAEGRAPTLPIGGESGVRGAPTLPRMIANWKHWLVAKFGIKFQQNFWDTRLRDAAHYAEKFDYVCRNPVRKGLVGPAVGGTTALP